MKAVFPRSMTVAGDAGNLAPEIEQRNLLWRPGARSTPYDIATAVVIGAALFIALWTAKDYAISNDEGVQHHYGELIIAYFASGFTDQSVFHFQNLYLYGGLFDIVAVALAHLIPVDPYDLRHVLCTLIGVGGIVATVATARSIAGPRAGLFAAVGLCVCGAWYGTIFNHTKDIPFAAAMMGATFFLIRIARRLPSPRAGDIATFGLLAGAALGVRVLGLLLLIYVGFAIVLYLPRPGGGRSRSRFVAESSMRLLPAFILAYVIMIIAWPWAALAPLNPFRGLLEFSEFHYNIRTVFAGQVYDMADVPRSYVPTYFLIRMPLLTLLGATLAMIYALSPRSTGSAQPPRRDIALLGLTVIFPLACQVICHGPAFTGLRHFLFVIPPLTALAGIGLDRALTAFAARGRLLAAGGLAFVTAGYLLNAVTLFRLHPYEYLYYNPLVGGLQGASRRYDLDYWFNSMPEAINKLEAYLRNSPSGDSKWKTQTYSVAVCGERLAFDKNVTLPQLRWDFMPTWSESRFLHRAHADELRWRCRRQGGRHRRAPWCRHRLYQGPEDADPALDGRAVSATG